MNDHNFPSIYDFRNSLWGKIIFLRTLQLFRTSSDISIEFFSSPLLKFLALSGLKSFASSYTVALLPQTRNLFHLAKLPYKTSSVMSFALI